MLEFLKLAFATQGVAQGAEEFLRLLNEVEEDGHAFNVEMFGLNVEDDGTQKGLRCALTSQRLKIYLIYPSSKRKPLSARRLSYTK